MKRYIFLIFSFICILIFSSCSLESEKKLSFSEIPYGIELGYSLEELRSCDPSIMELSDGSIVHDGIDSFDYGSVEGLFSVMIAYGMGDDDSLDSVRVYCVYGSDSILAKDTSFFEGICDKMIERYGDPDDTIIPIVQTWHDGDMNISATYISGSDYVNYGIVIEFSTE